MLQAVRSSLTSCRARTSLVSWAELWRQGSERLAHFVILRPHSGEFRLSLLGLDARETYGFSLCGVLVMDLRCSALGSSESCVRFHLVCVWKLKHSLHARAPRKNRFTLRNTRLGHLFVDVTLCHTQKNLARAYVHRVYIHRPC